MDSPPAAADSQIRRGGCEGRIGCYPAFVAEATPAE